MALGGRGRVSMTSSSPAPLTVLHFSRETVERLYAEVPAVRQALQTSADAHSPG